MPVWVLWTLGAGAAGWLLDQAGDAAEQTGTAFEKAAKWAVIGGALYIAFRVGRSQGIIK